MFRRNQSDDNDDIQNVNIVFPNPFRVIWYAIKFYAVLVLCAFGLIIFSFVFTTGLVAFLNYNAPPAKVVLPSYYLPKNP